MNIENRCIKFREIHKTYGLNTIEAEWYSRCYRMAEDMVKSATVKNPEKAKIILNSFWALCPTTFIFKRINSDIYKAHVEELLSRIINQQDLKPATLAECFAYFGDLIFSQTLSYEATFSMFYLYQKIFLNHHQSEFLSYYADDQRLHQQKDRIIQEMRFKLAANRGGRDLFLTKT